MKNSLKWVAAALTFFLLNSCASGSLTKTSEAKTTGYDGALAQQLGADKIGMKQYVMAFLKSGTNRNQSAAEATALQKAHMDNINRLAKEGKLVLAGPFMDNGEFRGIYVFDVTNIEEARKLTESDPAVQAGRLVMDLHPWYGSAALMQVNETHNKITAPAN